MVVLTSFRRENSCLRASLSVMLCRLVSRMIVWPAQLAHEIHDDIGQIIEINFGAKIGSKRVKCG